MDRLRQSLLDTPITEKDGYQYFVHPISDGVPMLEPELLREITVRIVQKADLDGGEVHHHSVLRLRAALGPVGGGGLLGGGAESCPGYR